MNDDGPQELPAGSPRLSQNNARLPALVPTNLDTIARRHSDSTQVSPTTSKVEPETSQEEPAKPRPHIRTMYDQWPDSVDDFSRRVSVAGSGLPPPGAVVAAEKEVVEDQPRSLSQPARDSIRSTFLEVPTVDNGSPRFVQSPRPAEISPRLPSIDVNSLFAERRSSRQGSETLSRLSFDSVSSAGDSHLSAEDGANVIFEAARQARLKRPSLVNHPAAGGSGIQLANLARFIKDREIQEMEIRPLTRASTVTGNPPTPRRLGGFGDGALSPGLSIDRMGNAINPPNTARESDSEFLSNSTEPLSLQDALRLNPIDPSAIPKRSVTVPAGIGSKRKTRFAPLALNNSGASRFKRDSIVTTPYPKLSSSDSNVEKAPDRTDSTSPQNPIEFSLTIFARGQNNTISIPQFKSAEPKTDAWWNAKEADDKKLVELAKAEYIRIKGRLRHYCGAKSAKSVRMRFVRSNKSDHAHEPDSPLIGGRWDSYAESEFWSLWCNPALGSGKREWLDILTNHTRIYGPSRTFVLEIMEGYNAVRILVVFSIITLLSLLGMFLWLFFGVTRLTGFNDIGTFAGAHGAGGLEPSTHLVSGSPSAAFIFGIWILFLGWTGAGAWVIVG